MENISRRNVRAVRKKLLAWYRGNRRDLPWRNTSDPYRIWISEVMLAQTRVETVVPYYRNFLEAFPTLERLAQARRDRLLKAWEGLGYYGRARNLQAAAKEVVESYGGKLPDRSGELRRLKGFGPYTSAAVASIAFGEPVACVDGNVRRVISRLRATRGPVDGPARELLDPGDPSAFNQGMMELGARVCLPRNPRCGVCPLGIFCLARKRGRVADYPARAATRPVPVIPAVALFVTRGSAVFIRRRPEKGLWGGLWEFPTVETDSVQTAIRSLRTQHRLEVRRARPAGRFRHFLSHRTMLVEVLRGPAEEKERPQRGKWVAVTSLADYPFSRLARRVEEAALAKGEASLS